MSTESSQERAAPGDGAPDYVVNAEPTTTFGRVLLHVRDQHLVVDGPARNGCPGEAATPAELFLGGVASCAVELLQVLARERQLPLEWVDAEVGGTIDRAGVVRSDVTVFASVSVHLRLRGVGAADAAALVEAFTGR